MVGEKELVCYHDNIRNVSNTLAFRMNRVRRDWEQVRNYDNIRSVSKPFAHDLAASNTSHSCIRCFQFSAISPSNISGPY